MEEGSFKIREVPTNILKKRKQRELSKAKQLRDQVKKTFKGKKKRLVFSRAEKFVKENRKRSKDLLRLKRSAPFIVQDMEKAKEEKEQGMAGEPKLLFVVRLARSLPLSDPSKKALKTLGLWHKYQGVFVTSAPHINRLLKIAEPYITWGEPSLRTVRELFFKRAFIRIPNKKSRPLVDNTIVEQKLGHLGLICVEDLIHEIYSLGENFNKVQKLVGRFQLSDPADKPKTNEKMSHTSIGGSYGYRGEQINALVQAII